VGSRSKATEDLATALSYIFENADMFDVSTENDALWGSSAGARMVGDVALNGVAGFGGRDLPKPCVVVIAYTGHTSFSENYPPTFITVSRDDSIVSVSVVDRRVADLRNAGIDVAYHKYENAGHGFGLGVGTDAQGWLEDAIQFWENHLSE
jgi:acetyl esterase/lipase